MLGRIWKSAWGRMELGARARREHELWLTQALGADRFRRESEGFGPTRPRIPTRKVSEGGFDLVRDDSSARRWADHWWAATFDRMDPGR